MLRGAIALPAIKALFPEAARVLLGPNTSSSAGSCSRWAELSQRMGTMERFSYPTENRAFLEHFAEVSLHPGEAPSAGSCIWSVGRNIDS